MPGLRNVAATCSSVLQNSAGFILSQPLNTFVGIAQTSVPAVT